MATENETNAEGKGENQPSYVTVDQLNAAISSKIKAALKDVATTTSMKSMVDEIRQAMTQQQPTSEKTAESKKGEVDPQIKAMQQQFEQMKTQLKQEQDLRAQVERKRSEDKARGEIRALLTGAADPKLKVKDEFVDVLVGHFMDSKKAVKLGDDGNATMTVRRSIAKGIDPEDVDLPLREGIAEWLKSNDARAWLPAPSSSGGGPNQRRVTPPATTPASGTEATGGGDAIANTLAQLASQGIDLG